MSYYTQEQIDGVREIDLLSYLRSREPDNLKYLGGGNYCTKDHDSLKISNGMWHWFSRHIGGKNALDYLMKVRGLSFSDAMAELSSDAGIIVHEYIPPGRQEKTLKLPELEDGIPKVTEYLQKRGISKEVIDYCYNAGVLREDKQYHSCVFLGFDGGKAKYGAVRSTVSDFKRDFSGSDKRFSFCIPAEQEGTVVHIFEAAIDAMSYMTLCSQFNGEHVWERESLLSLSGVYASDDGNDIPLALETYLDRHPQTQIIALHLDNDEVGRLATQHIIDVLGDSYCVLDQPAKSGKDYNDYLLNSLRQEKRKEKER